MNPLIQHIIDQLREVQTGKPWMGPTYARKLAGLDEPLVFERPLPNMHSVAEIISHLTLWRKETLLKIRTGMGSKTDACEENWLTNDILRKKGWAQIKSEYDQSLTELIELLEGKDDAFLSEQYYDTDFKGNYPFAFVLNGMLHHDIYHLGQLGLILKFLKKSPES
jgi:hypothetical protein